jgi:TolA-binding protein
MASTRNYKSGAVIYFDGDKSDNIFVLKSGSITLTYLDVGINEHLSDRLNVGEFFGVKSAIGHFKREETAHVDKDSTVLILSVKEFEELVVKNVRLALKMLKVFSTQLRKVGKQSADIISASDSESVDRPELLFNVGKFFLKGKRFDHATYAFHKYVENYPDGSLYDDALQGIDMAKSGITGEEDNMEDDGEGSLYDKAINLMKENQFEEAIDNLNQIKSADGGLKESIMFKLSSCHFELGKYEKTVNVLTDLIKEFPSTKRMKEALLHIGKSYNGQGDKSKAKGFFNKVLQMPPVDDNISLEAKNFLGEGG